MSKNTGFVFGALHNIQPDVPEENLKAVFETVHDLREYSENITSSLMVFERCKWERTIS